jgi:hypothetical protein
MSCYRNIVQLMCGIVIQLCMGLPVYVACLQYPNALADMVVGYMGVSD